MYGIEYNKLAYNLKNSAVRLDPVGKLSQVERDGKIDNNPQPLHPVPGPGAGPDPDTPIFGLNAGNAAPTQIPSFTKQGHVTYKNAAFWMLMAVLPTVRSDSKPGVTIRLRGVIEGR